MHDIWNPWHGCRKKSEGCRYCYMYFLDRVHNNKIQSNIVYKTNNFNYPLQRERSGEYKVKSGEMLRVCMTSDFYIEEADQWRDEVWEIIRQRKDVKFFILTKRPERAVERLPQNIDEILDNVFFNVTCENQEMADQRIPILISLPFKHKGIMCAPFIGEIHIDKYLDSGQIEQVIVGGENYDGARVCSYDWVYSLHEACVKRNITFCFMETGSKFLKDGKIYNIPDKVMQSKMAYKSGLNFNGKKIDFKLYDEFLNLISDDVYKPYFNQRCKECGSKIICNGCSNCGKCN